MVEKELKKGLSDFDSGTPILVTAELEAINRIRENSVHKVAFIVKVKDSLDTTKERIFAALKVVEFNNYLELIGIELQINNKTKKTQKIDRYSQVLEKAEEEVVVNLKFPWHKINEIQNASYQHKVQNKGK
jgi:hypothetical protein